MTRLMEILKNLTRGTASDKMQRDKTFNIPKGLKYDGYQRGLVSMTYKFFVNKTSAKRARSKTLPKENKFAGSGIKNENMSNKMLAEKLHKSIIGKTLKN